MCTEFEAMEDDTTASSHNGHRAKALLKAFDSALSKTMESSKYVHFNYETLIARGIRFLQAKINNLVLSSFLPYWLKLYIFIK